MRLRVKDGFCAYVMSNKISYAGPNTVSKELQKVIQQRKEETQSRIKLTHVIYIREMI